MNLAQHTFFNDIFYVCSEIFFDIEIITYSKQNKIFAWFLCAPKRSLNVCTNIICYPMYMNNFSFNEYSEYFIRSINNRLWIMFYILHIFHVPEYKFCTTMYIRKMSRFHDFPHVPGESRVTSVFIAGDSSSKKRSYDW